MKTIFTKMLLFTMTSTQTMTATMVSSSGAQDAGPRRVPPAQGHSISRAPKARTVLVASSPTVATSPAPSLDGGKPFAYGGKPFLAPPLGRPSRSRRTRALDNMTPDEDKVAGIWCKHQFAQSIRRRSGLWLPIASFTVNDVIVATLRCVLGKLLYTADKFSAEVYGPVVFKIMDHCYDGSYTSITGVSLQCVWTSVAAWVGHRTSSIDGGPAEAAAEAASFGFA
ncbi:BZ3500_MvSof-1268-A1-R1_Chr5-2g07890 [Microbotryum saponariae]|uniref:BZ3500_MvSof-1268-A1-R1_Chr5-2g07890 protein n=1 Tax=Microbotryum saponariae TaxID=289078 RepID=A0A2X0KG05_9BASI|nr:BZ3500_MvSof-1268-A1-R1_Chr5-2g07890 [Microbotryum saponariae]SDA05759.1 BZ3501_MvSof-1269-A2-R1_Chr5-2g07712 [Microbotryum saponariae]